jgi:mannose-1-phosphate guanylyltransferase
MPVKGQPLLDVWLHRLTDAGLGPFLINTHYLADQVESYVRGSAYRDRITLVHEPKLRGTAGTLIANLSFFEGKDGLLIHADNYCLEDFRKFVDAHLRRPPECVMTMMTFRTENPSSCGVLEVDSQGVVTSFHEKVANPPGNLANGAIYILSAELLEAMGSTYREVCDFSTEVLGRYMGRIYAYETDKPLVDIGTVEAYTRVNGN